MSLLLLFRSRNASPWPTLHLDLPKVILRAGRHQYVIAVVDRSEALRPIAARLRLVTPTDHSEPLKAARRRYVLKSDDPDL